MDGLTAAGSVPAALQAEGTANLTLLKKSQDLMAQQASALLSTLPPTPALSPNPPGVGGHIDVVA